MKLNTDTIVDHDVPVGYRSYRIKGVDKTIIAKKGGPSADDIRNKSSYEELRNNQKEFAVASVVSKVFRDSLSDGLSEICESYVSGRLTAKFRNIASEADGVTGMRPMHLSKFGHFLNGFEFNTTAPYKEVFDAKYHVKSGSRKGQVILHFPSFIPDMTLQKPQGATNFKIQARLIALSDYHYDLNIDNYVAENVDFNGKFGSWNSPMLPILKIPTEPITAQVSMYEKDLPEDMAIFLVMAVSFYKYEQGVFHHLSKDSAMTIKQVY